jgi:dolichol-phosphate mannosyltransferase
VSLIVPLYDEEQAVPLLIERVLPLLASLPGGPHEAIFVNDGSRDRTWELLCAAAAAHDRILAVSLSRNFGHQAALTAGLDHAAGDAIIVMDGDLQDDPGMVPRFVELYRAGYDVVYAQRVRRKEPWWLRASYATFYRLIGRIADVPLPVDAGDFGLMSRQVVSAIQEAPERNRFLRGLRAWAGFRQIGVPVERARRASGQSKYGIWKLTRLAMDGIFAFSVVPIRLAAVAGALAVAGAGLFGAYALYAKLVLERSPQGFTALALLVILMAGVNLLFLGIIGEYVGRVYREVKQRPVYIVAEVVGLRKSIPAHTADG